MIRAITLTLSFLVVLSAVAIGGKKDCGNLFAVECNGFCTSRDFPEYDRTFGGDLSKALKALAKQGGHWVDMGAGQGYAQLTYLKKNKDGHLSATAVAYEIPGGEAAFAPTALVGRAIKAYGKRYRYLEGWLDSSMANKIGQADVITDVYGIFSYTQYEKRRDILSLYVAMLKPGGKIFIDGDVANHLSDGWLRRHSDMILSVRPGAGVMSYSVLEKIR